MKKLFGRNTISIGLVVILALGIGFWAGYEYKEREVKKAVDKALSELSGQELKDSENTGRDSIEDFKIIKYSQGETIKFVTQSMKFNSARSSNTITAGYGTPLVADKGTKFVIVDHTVTNTTNDPFTYDPYIVFDNDNRHYNSLDEAIGNIDNYLYVRELPPNVPETGVIVFKVPKDTKTFLFGASKAQTNEIHAVEFSVN